MTLRAPFPWFGGKSRAAHIVWGRFGDVANYIEPFAGSLAVLLARPTPPRIETVNDLDCMVANFWRATQKDPEAVAKFADWPVNEADLHARHRWLVAQIPTHRERMMSDPDYFDAKIAGWWVWGLCQWVGGRWCGGELHHIRPKVSGDSAGMGVHALVSVHATCAQIAHRMRRTRVLCGDWKRAVGDAVLFGGANKNVLTAICLDPPYLQTERDERLYATETNVSAAVREWALERGDDSRLRIALCGYEGEHTMPDSWECVAWKSTGTREDQATRERIWFSPHCLRPDKGQIAMFGAP